VSESPGGVQIMTTWRVPERQVTAACAMCGRERTIVFDLTAGSGGRFDVMSVCDECAPRAERLMSWLGTMMAGQ
jgi:ClpX C4-type zinc finger